MTTRIPLVRIGGKIVDLPSTDVISGAPSGANGTNGTNGTTSPLTTKGDIWTYSTVDARIGVGTNGNILMSDSGSTPGIKWTSTLTKSLTFSTGSTSAATAPFYLASGSLMSSAEYGAVEFLTDKAYLTISSGTPARKELALNDAALTSGRIPFTTTNGRIKDASDLQWNGSRFQQQGTSTGDYSYLVQNQSTGTAAYGGVFSENSANYCGMLKLSTGYTTAGLAVAGLNWFTNDAGNVLMTTASTSYSWIVATAGSGTTNERLRCDGLGNVSIGNAALATTATDGFLHIPTCAGPPTGVPTGFTGRVPLVYDTTNNNLYVRNGGAWKKTTTFA